MSAFQNEDLDIDQYLYTHHYSNEGPVECTNDVLTLSKLLNPPKLAENLTASNEEQSSALQPSFVPPFTPGSIGRPKQAEAGLGDSNVAADWNEYDVSSTAVEGAFVEPNKLVLPLPHPVEAKRTDSAKFVEGVLLVSLGLNREYELLNK
ncbi:hypothetical protein RvY_15644 [Ramazzottius varieornatus]|uniref:Uncharacterized protein n=1 Tax=Ramazzottius varieornatus TaxID=947166 RepID=A0A1D1VX73_RAMVA|nr:hypothetical protein RvY_15644 [Ramazzottius varieornatus]